MKDQPLELTCRERVTGKGRTGRLCISDKRMRLKLSCFDEFFFIKTEEPISVDLEDASVATLFDCISSGPGGSSRHDRKVYFQTIIPNAVLIGADQWNANKLVRCATFGFIGSNVPLLTTDIIDLKFEYPSPETAEAHQDKASGERDVVTVDYGKTTILNVTVANLEVRVWCSVSRSHGPFQETIKIDPRVTVDFHLGVSVHEYLVIICDIVGLFALSIGQPSRPYNIHVNALSSVEIEATAKSHDYPESHSARYVWPKMQVDRSRAWPGASVLQVLNTEEREATKAVLVAWINRRAEWRAAYALMMGALRLQNEIGADRLMKAFAWFEAIPLDEKSKSVSSKQADEIAAAAIKEASALGLVSQTDRIKSSLKKLAKEPLTERFQRLIESLEDQFGKKLVPSGLEQDCVKAIRFRGAAAHGGLNLDENRFDEFSRCVHAVECVAFLLMLRDLPISDGATDRIRGNSLMDYLRL